MPEESQACPICGAQLRRNARYPRYLCGDCASRVTASDGRPLRFSNLDFGGGYAAHYAATGEAYPSHECFVDGIRCRADEARFGGIVIERAD